MNIKELWLLIRRHYRKIFQTQLLSIISVLGIVTFPAGVAGANRVYIKLIRDKNVLVWQEWKEGFVNSLRESVLLGGTYFLGILLGMQCLSSIFMPLRAFGIIWTLLILVWGSNGFLLLAVQDTSACTLLKNSLFLVFVEWKTAMVSVLLWILEIGGILIFFPYSMFLIFLCVPALFHFLRCWVLWRSIERRIVIPWKQGKK